ncbi:hypothetical protein CFC21_058490 [Triticum aestivum]|uniref:Polymerase nucleotidyl transferase domain-containing protein n=3 Tax=Triticum TaxID=4564 RepID=A0A9R0T767_TRITD|nr:uncharacterized protein LOC123093015 [Triticum aestivum]KAF7050077.1 hypothetical protein CFC21_058490 [Triticum aestivum]VAI08485.1 unnamed protein product [Triticum turgidum subsp. durum]
MAMVPNGLLPNASAGVTRRLDPDRWAVAESRTAELIARIQPNAYSEGRRHAVYNYVQRLIMNCLSCQVFTFGSVPLKTYLPDGDIDVTAFSNSEELKDTWANLVRDALEREEKSENAEFCVKEVQYIQAEVKLIKCLVDNIVVDISFNQVGGLCTLCFLEQVDNLINQNHLFKRSIILVKAWCFYESRILGAHHGLISTYALETLVLYIFHVFNNCFTGPLEVLYRFLEFFSNFDWEKFCLSLWGPVPISSLPDMTAEPPRMDTGELLLTKAFLDRCNHLYGVMPRTQENQGQPFVSKHFNVIDPLRANNNLGRSVSKGNYFRIRSAFSFGAKRLAKLLECPNEDLIAEVNQFFTNTLTRHGSGNRPDAPTPNLFPKHALKVVPAEASNSHENATMPKKKMEKPKLRANQGSLTEGSHSYAEPISQQPQRSDLRSRNSPKAIHPAVSHAQHQKINVTQPNTKVSEPLERNRSGGSMPSERDGRMPNALFVNGRNGQNMSPFARTQSSPELTDPSIEGYSRGRRTRVVEMEKPVNNDYNSRRNNLVPEVPSNHSTKSSQDESMSSMNSSSHPSAKAASESNSVSSSYHEDNGFAINEELPSVSEASEMQHEEHALVNLMASAKLHGFNGQAQLPMQLPSHMSVASLPLLPPTAFPQKPFAGIPPASLIGSQWLHNMQFLQGFVPPPMAHYTYNPSFAPNTEDGNESEKSTTSDSNLDPGNTQYEYGFRLSRNFNHEGRDSHVHHFDDNNRSSSPNGVSGSPLDRQMQYTVEDSRLVEENYTNMFQNQTSREVRRNAPMSSGNLRTTSQPSSSKSKPLSESSWDERAAKTSRASRDKWEKKPAFPALATTTLSISKTGWQTGNSSDHMLTEADEGARNGVVVPVIRHEASDIVTGSVSSDPSRTSQVRNDFNASWMPNPMFAPFLIGSSQQRQADNSGLTFVPTGPPVPFVVLPFVPGNSDGSVPQFEGNDGIDQFPVNVAVQNFSSLNDVHQPDNSATSATTSSTVANPSYDHKPDILNSDIASHWQNLQYGRFCQDARPMGPVLYPFAVPPGYMQGHVPWDGPGRPPSPNVNWTQMVGPGQRAFPMMPLQPASERVTAVPPHYGEHAPRYRGGTGTYLPNPKVPFRDRERPSSSRYVRGGYNSDKGDNGDKEGSWANSRQRNTGRNYGRSQSERYGMRSDRQTTDEGQFDRQRRSYRNDSHRHEAGAQYLGQGQSHGSTNSTRRPGNVTHGVYSSPYAVPNGVGASDSPYFMVYPYEPAANHGSSSEPLEFGSLGPISMADDGDLPQPTRQVMANGFYGQRHTAFRVSSSHSSPDQPSSPQPRR